eukprot:Colp12_sorted_trinity150504_noHs@9786
MPDILLPDGSITAVAFPPAISADKAKEVLLPKLNGDVSKKGEYQFLEYMIPTTGAHREGREISDDEILDNVLEHWANTKVPGETYYLKFVNKNHFITLNFNTYFRMAQGVGPTSLKVWVQDGATVGDVIKIATKQLTLKLDQSKYGMSGVFKTADEATNTKELQADEKVLELRRHHETESLHSFFQFQLKEDLSTLMKPDKVGWLTKEGGSFKSWKERWFVLKGTSLFYYKSEQDKEPIGEVPNLNSAQVYQGESQKKGFLFHIQTPERLWNIIAKDRTDGEAWVEAIAACGKRTKRDETGVAKQESLVVKKLAGERLVESSNVGRLNIESKEEKQVKANIAAAKAQNLALAEAEIDIIKESEKLPEIQRGIQVDAAFDNIFARTESVTRKITPVDPVLTKGAEQPSAQMNFEELDDLMGDLASSLAQL